MGEERYHVVVVGGGPAGLFTAWKLAEKGVQVLVLEEHSEIGKPVQCAGLVTPRVFEMVGLSKKHGLPVRGAVVHPPEGEPISFKAKVPKALVLERTLLDQHIAYKAVKKGAELSLRTKFLGFKRKEKDKLELTALTPKGKKRIETKILVGADGFYSKVRKLASLYEPEKTMVGFQVDYSGSLPKDFDRESVFLYLGRRYAPDFFAWVIPLAEGVRVGLSHNPFWKRKRKEKGLGSEKRKERNALELYKLFVKEKLSSLLSNMSPLRLTAGAIPFGPLKQFTHHNIVLVGDAAAQVKATSGGGVYTSLASVEELVPVLLKALERENYTKEFLSLYQKRWTKGIGKELRKAYILHKAFTRMSDARLSEFICLLNQKEIIEIIEKEGDIDYPSRLAFSIFKRKPQLIKFSPALLNSFI